jgi:predicted outer membrane lipoprotein
MKCHAAGAVNALALECEAARAVTNCTIGMYCSITGAVTACITGMWYHKALLSWIIGMLRYRSSVKLHLWNIMLQKYIIYVEL